MSLFSAQRSKSARASRSAPPAPHKIRPLRIEQLEGREMMAVTYHGGGYIPHIAVQGVYYGKDWSSGNAYNMTGRLEGFLQYIVKSPYMDMMNNAGYGVGRGTYIRGTIYNKAIDKTQYVRDSVIKSDLQSMIERGIVAAPTANRVYMVYVEPGAAIWEDPNGGTSTSSSGNNSFLGFHNAFRGHDRYYRPTIIHYTVMAYPGGYNYTSASGNFRTNFDQLTEVTGHEIAESVTDPNVTVWDPVYRRYLGGWYDGSPYGGEIADLEVGKLFKLGGYCVQKLANKNDIAMTAAGATVYYGYNGYAYPLGNQSQLVGIQPQSSPQLASTTVTTADPGLMLSLDTPILSKAKQLANDLALESLLAE